MAVAGEGTGLEGESSSVSYTEEEVSYVTEEDSEDEGKRVEWPPHGHKGQGQAPTNGSHIKTFAAESIFHNDKQNKESLGTGREVFKPARMKTEEKWNPAKQNPGFQPPAIDTSKPKAKFRDIGDIMHTGTSKHTSYHIPPGTSRTRKAQEMYNKHLNGMNIPPETMTTTQ